MGPSEETYLIENIKGKVEKIQQIHADTCQENKELKSEKNDLLHKIEDCKSKIKDLETKYNYLKLAKATELSSTDKDEAKQKINRIMREIDQCISLLNS